MTDRTTGAAARQPVAADAVTVLIVDDHPIVRQGLRGLLMGGPRRYHVGEAQDGRGALQQVRRLMPDVVVLDLDLPTPRGTTALCREIIALSPETRILICTAFADADRIGECITAGARGCILKDAATADFTTTLARMKAGETVIEPRIAQELAVRFTRDMQQPGVRLTQRERAVLVALGDGCSNRQIADRLVVSEYTVKGHVTSILRKLGARSRLEAVVLASSEGLLSARAGRGPVEAT